MIFLFKLLNLFKFSPYFCLMNWMHRLRIFFRHSAWILALCGSATVAAVDLSWTGFGTLGYSQSNRDYAYLRFIDSGGTFQTDSLLGGQVDAQISKQWSAALQVQLRPSLQHESAWDLKPSLAFVAWRPDDDWLLRAGRFRAPLLMFSESIELGTSYDMARLPHELYGIFPIKEFDGLYVSRFWPIGDRELTAEVFGGTGDTTLRAWVRNELPPIWEPGAFFSDTRITSRGYALTLRDRSTVWRAGLTRAKAYAVNPSKWVASFPWVQIAPGLGYWQVSDALPGPGVSMVQAVTLDVLTAGVEKSFGQGWRVAAELGQAKQLESELSVSAMSGYVMLSKDIGNFTPYLSLSRVLSDSKQRRWYENLSHATLPAAVPNAAALVAAQRAMADLITIYDQYSYALGTSYAFDSDSKIKIEWVRTHIGLGSTLVDSPAHANPVGRTHIDALSFNYSFVF